MTLVTEELSAFPVMSGSKSSMTGRWGWTSCNATSLGDKRAPVKDMFALSRCTSKHEQNDTVSLQDIQIYCFNRWTQLMDGLTKGLNCLIEGRKAGVCRKRRTLSPCHL
ncbi:unnamed protein product [Lepeophtheirus salmonis]|uniref:(salmon louse) hypothetical protein n=1 Tax=Lepeophtheirus salmonis TaxID=72036 RepID=A0A7R8D4L8_LEPSM|nr:unnamed protein product [Lepeophtheirus salmonis]CAF3027143.1 unnamed protein product [Lepeophtheirus salmonis]